MWHNRRDYAIQDFSSLLGREIMGKQELKKTNQTPLKVAFLSFLTELPNFVGVTVSAVLSGSLIVWMDFVDSFCNVLNCGLIALLYWRLRRDLKYEYNYGVGKVEAISSLACNGILICGLIFMVISSVHDIISLKEPSGLLIYVVILKVINVTFDAIFLRAQYKIKQEEKTTIANTEFYATLKSFCFDAVALVSILVCWIFREVRVVWYFSPIICIALAVWFFIGAIGRAKKAVRILTDRTLPEKEQLKIVSVLAEFRNRYKGFEFAGTRMSGNTAYIDLKLDFDDDTAYCEIKKLCEEITAKMEEKIEGCHVEIVIDSYDNRLQ